MFQVKAGDHYGFTWLSRGVIKYAQSETQSYCENEAIFDVGDEANLVAGRSGNRDYSLRVAFTECEEDGSSSSNQNGKKTEIQVETSPQDTSNLGAV